MTKADLERVREWAAQRIGSQSEAPWDWYQLMKLREALDALIASDDAAAMLRTEDLPRQAPRSGTHLRLVDADK